MLDHSRSILKKMVVTVKDESTGMETEKQLRFKCYRKAVLEKYGYLGVKEKRRMEYCYERLARETFPKLDAKYTGYAKLDGTHWNNNN